MSLKLKILGLGVLAVMATSAFAVMNASATVNGHFTHEAADGHASVIGSETFGTAHSLEFQHTRPTGTKNGEPIVCTNASYSGTVTTATVTSLTVTPTYSNCGTKGNANHSLVHVRTNGCTYTFFSNSSASTHNPTGHATVTVNCPPNEEIEVEHTNPSCRIHIPPQTLNGATYTTTSEGKHTLTVGITIQHITGHFEGGICIFLGTTQLFDMNGAVKVEARNTLNQQVGVTAT